ncbi:MAG: cupin domain-containing protein [Crocinitomicaceae bacterium]|nr:cupin domain-containing protein [Crocinitomicaceae bacterium]
MSKDRIQQIIKNYSMESHPEGGFYKETYRGPLEINNRSNATSIYFLLDGNNVSHFHSIKSDELWYFHEGDPLRIHMISPHGDYSYADLGGDLDKGQTHQTLVPAGYIFGSERLEGSSQYSLVGCVVSPGFDFSDFRLYTEEEILALIPNEKELASRLT